MKKQNKEWHRDEIEKLKWQQSNVKWKITAITTIFLTFVSLCYVIWYSEEGFVPRALVVIVFICVLIFTRRHLRQNMDRGKEISKNIEDNYRIILKSS
ncbi:MAG: hypothetical protein AABX23_00255 [Nanoarchaeota archaeon]